MKRTGTVEAFTRLDGSTYYRVRIHLADGSRPRINIPAEFAGDAATREKYARKAQEHEDRTGSMLKGKLKIQRSPGAVEIDAMITCDEYASKVFEAREAEGKRSVQHERSLWNKWISPRLGKRPLALVTRDQIEDVRNVLDDEVKQRMAHGLHHGLAGKSAMNVWTTVRTVFGESVSSRDRAMRIRKDDPTVGHKPPHRTLSRQKTFIHPSEAAALLACEAVPLEWRELYAIAIYTYLRPGELRALTWRDVDADAGLIHISKAYDEASCETRQPKTRAGMREVPIEAALLPLLKRMKKAANDKAALVVPLLAATREDVRARVFRSHLAQAKVERDRLTEETSTTMGINFRSCRDTGITWLAMAGVPIVAVQRRAGHEKIETSAGYCKIAEDHKGKLGVPFAPLPASLVGSVDCPSTVQTPGGKHETSKKLRQNGSGRGDLNPVSASTDDASPRESAAIVNPSRPQKERVDGLDSRLDSLRQALDAAIVAQQWGAVEAINSRLRELEREGVIDLATARAKRGG